MTLRSGQAHGSIRTWRRHFPLTSVDDVVELFRDILLTYGFRLLDPSERLKTLHCEEPLKPGVRHSLRPTENGVNIPILHTQEPDLAFVSILLGSIEHQLTEPDGSVRLKARPSQNLSFSPANHKVSCSPLSVHVELAEEDLFVGSNFEPTTPDQLSHSPGGSETKSLCGSSSTSRYRTNTRRRRGAERARRRYGSYTSSDQNVLPTFDSSGYIHKSSEKRRRFSDSTMPSSFPCVTFEETEQQYQDFYNLITTSPKLLPYIVPSVSKAHEVRSSAPTIPPTKNQWATRQLICAVCEVLWGRMAVNKSRERLAHSQSIHSLLSAGILDSFGLAYTTVAACRLLGYLDVDLALSEDHGWVEFGPPDARQTADVASWVPGAHLLTARDQDATDRMVALGVEKEVQDKNQDTANPPPIRVPPLVQSWLYVNGRPVICRPSMRAVAAAVAALQPGASLPAGSQAPVSAPLNGSFGTSTALCTPDGHGSSDLISPNGLARHLSSASAMSMQLVTLKHRLLWLFFDAGCLSRYPLGLTNLGDLEDAFPCTDNLRLFSSELPTANARIPPIDNVPPDIPESAIVALALYNKAVEVNQSFYANQHVYPYTCLASCLYRHGDNRGALRYWSEAARVMGHYNHSSEDWEIYRELLEVATQLMPNMFRCAAEASRSCSEGAVDTDPDGSLYQPGNILDDPQCLAYLLAFYDHLCLWEEGSPVPVLHVGWVDKLMVGLTRFSQRARRLLRLSINRSRFQDNTPECVPSASEPTGLVDVGPPSKRARRHSRSVLPDREEHQQPSPSVAARTPKTQSQDVWSATIKPKADNGDNPTDIATNATSVQDADQHPSKPGTRTPLSTIPTMICSYPVNASVDQPKSPDKKNLKSKAKDKTKGITVLPGSQAPTELSPNAPNLKSGTLTGLLDQNSDPQDLFLQDATNANAFPTADFPTHDDLLMSLAEACGQRLLNPAFLWGLERNMPFLPPNTAPEEAFTRFFSELEHDSTSLFITPPNSGDSYEPVADKLATCPNPKAKLLSDVDDFQTAGLVLSAECIEGQASEHSSDIPLFPDCLDSVDGAENMVTLDDISDEFLQSVSDLVQNSPPVKLQANMHESSTAVAESSEPNVFSSQETNQTRPVKPKTMEELMVNLVLSSIKMVSIVELLRAPRLNSSAIKLALTAQSQVCMRRTGNCPTSGV